MTTPGVVNSLLLFTTTNSKNELEDRLKVQADEIKEKNGDNNDESCTKNNEISANNKKLPQLHKWTIVWQNVILLGVLHAYLVYGTIFLLRHAHWQTVIWAIFIGTLSGFGITAGAHRLWSHRAYRARLPLRLLLCAFNTMALQTPIVDWVRDHRVHHKHTDTDADPHNAQRGFFFAHVGWLLVRKHPAVAAAGRRLDLADLRADRLLAFQKRWHLLLGPLLCFVMPAAVPWWGWGEDGHVASYGAVVRYVLSLHCTWAVNSFAHFYGNKPYDEHIKPSENVYVSLCTFGEGWHNYHHVFPWDYKTAELGGYCTNLSTGFIDLMAKIGWAYDLKTASPEMIEKRVLRTGHDKTNSANKPKRKNK